MYLFETQEVNMNEVVQSGRYWLLLIGLLGGTLSGALGVGSGILIIPALVLGLGIEQKVAQGICLAVMVPMALMGAYRYYVNPDINQPGCNTCDGSARCRGCLPGCANCSLAAGVDIEAVFRCFYRHCRHQNGIHEMMAQPC